jgi:hypothetical protein
MEPGLNPIVDVDKLESKLKIDPASLADFGIVPDSKGAFIAEAVKIDGTEGRVQISGINEEGKIVVNFGEGNGNELYRGKEMEMDADTFKHYWKQA